MNVERPECELMVLLTLIVGVWFILGVLVIGLLNLAKLTVRSATVPPEAAPAIGGSWPAAAPGRAESSATPPPFAGSAAAARQDGIVRHPTSR
jgi:hypothetical protein